MNQVYFIKLNRYEALLIDWVLTLHHWDEPTLRYLMGEMIEDELSADIVEMRFNAGNIIINQSENFHIPSYRALLLLLCLVPINHKMGDEHVGRTLKEKLYSAYFGVEYADEDKTRSPALGAEG